MKKLEKQTAIVTGSSSGIGLAVVKALAEAGAKVVVNYYSSEEDAAKVVDEIKAKGGEAIAIKADVSDEADVENLFSKTVEAFETVDIVVANAGMQKDAAFIDMTLEDWNRVIGVNLTGQFLCARSAVRQFVKQGVREGVSCAAGKLICMSSVHEVIPWAGHVNYAASKGGVNLMMQSIAQEMAPQKIRVNSIAPGAIKTTINKSAWGNPEALKKLLELIPAGRIGIPEDIAKAAVWLASDDSDYVQGTQLFIDGGMTLYPGFAENG